MITVAQAEKIIHSHLRDYGTEQIAFCNAAGRVLAEPIPADRDLPPFNRSTMDGIAISYASWAAGTHTFRIGGTVAAGDAPILFDASCECVEIMTGAPLPATADTVIRYEDLSITNGIATATSPNIKQGQNVHLRGRDRHEGDVVVPAHTAVDSTIISMAASTGATMLTVKKLPTVVIITTGDELVDADVQPTQWQIRKSNNYAIQAILQQHCIAPALIHIPDDKAATNAAIQQCLSAYDVIIMSGGVSAGKFDYVPAALQEQGVGQLFHKVQQRPGKPFWFGTHTSGKLVFAFPGNPVSAFMCMTRYFVPWLHASLSLPHKPQPHAVLDTDLTFEPALQYFLQVHLYIGAHCRLMAKSIAGNGSGDFANLLDTNAFMELPLEKTNFKQGEAYAIWPFKPIV